ncbi:SH3 domain-containing protein 2-like protein [Tanacetum coccineum]
MKNKEMVIVDLWVCFEEQEIENKQLFSFHKITLYHLLSRRGEKEEEVSNNGWAEGECKGRAGWFPLGYIERWERVLASKVQRPHLDRRDLRKARRSS